MSNAETTKRKEKSKRGVWRRRRIIAYIPILTIIAVLMFIMLTFPVCGCSPDYFSPLSTEIALTNDAVEILIQQTNTAIAQSTPHP